MKSVTKKSYWKYPQESRLCARGSNFILILICSGFPTPEEIHNGKEENATRAFLRRFTNHSSPQMQLSADNYQISWKGAYRVTERLWAFRLNSNKRVNYSKGDLIGVKSKCCGQFTTGSYVVRDSREILFERIKWTRQSRGVFRHGTSKMLF